MFKNLKENFVYLIFKIILILFLLLSISFFLYIGFKGYKDIFNLSFFSNKNLIYSLISTIQIIILSLGIACPIGIFAGIYFSEYADNNNKIIKFFRLCIQILNGIPSIVLGLFGLAFFVFALGFKQSLLSASLTLSIMILPLIIKTTEESFRTIPNALKEASLALGATETETVFRVLLPYAKQGIFTGIILCIGRVISESAILILTAGGSLSILSRFFSNNYPYILADSGRSLALHLYYQKFSYNQTESAFTTALILLSLILLLNSIVILIKSKK